jgi:hypothetical protein
MYNTLILKVACTIGLQFGGALGGLLLGTIQSLGKIGDMNQSKMPITEEKVEL